MQRRIVSGARALSWLAALAVATLCACEGPEPLPDDGGSTDAPPAGCVTGAPCDDDLFCNGLERCAPGAPGADARGCAPGASPCEATESCDEATDACGAACPVAEDADGDGAIALACGGDDCDDADPLVHPAASEVCDPDDRDEDCDATTYGERDDDRDGFDDAACCNGAGAARACGEDCDDRRRSTNPDTSEVCDGLDNDCDGAIDETVAIDGFWDEDLDGSGDAARTRAGCPGGRFFALSSGDCNDDEPHQSHLLPEVCDTIDNDCDGGIDENPRPLPWYLDDDDDGYASPHDDDVTIACEPPTSRHVLVPLDCDDSTVLRGPRVREICDGIDNDCNGWPDFFVAPFDYEDDDRDLFGDIRCGGTDCDDTAPGTFPGAPEIEDGEDQDCDGRIDEDPAVRTYYADDDGDGFGDPTATMSAAAPPAGHVVLSGDCDDADAERNPDALETCDGVDDDCDARIDEGAASTPLYADLDGDGRGRDDAARLFCVIGDALPALFVRDGGDCDDEDASAFPTAIETCDAVDDDCDTRVDEEAGVPYYVDGDADGAAAIGAAVAGTACAAPTGHSSVRTDCNDANPAIRVGATEICDVVDDDCDGAIDDAPSCPRMVYMTRNAYAATTIGGIAGADAICNSDPGHPGGVYRAMLFAPTRYPCTTPNCTGADVPRDWVIAPSTTYRTVYDGATLFTSNAEGLINFPMARRVDARTINFQLGATADWQLSSFHCSGWTSTGTGAVGWSALTDVGFIAGGTLGCGPVPLVCVQQ